MSKFTEEKVFNIQHWSDSLFSFRVTRSPSLRFTAGQFVMVGLRINHKLVQRAYSIASSPHDEFLEFFSIKVQDGPLTSQLQNIRLGDYVLISDKPTGSLVIRDLKPGKRLYLLSTGTGLAPFLSIIQDIETYEKFEQVIIVHGVRYIKDLAYNQFLNYELLVHEFYNDLIKDRFFYYPTVTREKFQHTGRITDLIENGKLFSDLHLPPFDYNEDRVMVCGSPAMLKDCCTLLDNFGFKISKHIGAQGDYVIERAFVEK